MTQKLMKNNNNEIENLQEKLNDIRKQKYTSIIDDYTKQYIKKYIKIILFDDDKVENPYITECMFVRDIFSDMDFDNISFTLQGQGFCYSNGEYLAERKGNFSDTYKKIIYDNWINNGTIKIDIISKAEYRKEVNQMLDFILHDFNDDEMNE